MAPGHPAKLADRVDDAEGKAHRRADQGDGVAGDGFLHGRRVGPIVVADRYPLDRQSQIVGGAVECGVPRIGDHHLRCARPGTLDARPVARRLHGDEDALRSARRDVAHRLGAVQQTGGEVDHLVLHDLEALKGPPDAAAVLLHEHGVGTLLDLEQWIAAVPDVEGMASAPPVHVALAHAAHALFQIAPTAPLLRQCLPHDRLPYFRSFPPPRLEPTTEWAGASTGRRRNWLSQPAAGKPIFLGPRPTEHRERGDTR